MFVFIVMFFKNMAYSQINHVELQIQFYYKKL